MLHFPLVLAPSNHPSTSFVFFLSFFFVFSVFFFRAATSAYGGSQARGQIRAVATSLHHGHRTPDPSRICDPHHSSWQRRILNTRSEARDRTRNLMVPRRIVSAVPQRGLPTFYFYKFNCSMDLM